MSHPDWDWFIATLCRASDPDRAPRFYRALDALHARGSMADLDDSPPQPPLPRELVCESVLSLLPPAVYDVIFTHGLGGEYTRHLRHEEASRAVQELWHDGKILASQLALFAYADQGRGTLPQPDGNAEIRTELQPEIWRAKYALITETYGFLPQSWEARCTPTVEAFRLLPPPGPAAERGIVEELSQ